jgi:hypothetical protein
MSERKIVKWKRILKHLSNLESALIGRYDSSFGKLINLNIATNLPAVLRY